MVTVALIIAIVSLILNVWCIVNINITYKLADTVLKIAELNMKRINLLNKKVNGRWRWFFSGNKTKTDKNKG